MAPQSIVIERNKETETWRPWAYLRGKHDSVMKRAAWKRLSLWQGSERRNCPSGEQKVLLLENNFSLLATSSSALQGIADTFHPSILIQLTASQMIIKWCQKAVIVAKVWLATAILLLDSDEKEHQHLCNVWGVAKVGVKQWLVTLQEKRLQ